MEQGREIFDQDEEGRIAELELRENYDLNNISSMGIFPDKVGTNLSIPSLTTVFLSPELPQAEACFGVPVAAEQAVGKVSSQ